MFHPNARGAAVILAAAAAVWVGCAGRPPSDSSPLGGGPPPGVTTAPATPSTGQATDPMPPRPDVTPPPTREPMGSFAARGEGVGPRPMGGAELAMQDSVSIRLDSVMSAAGSGLTKMPIPVAIGLVDFFRRYLSSTNDPALRGVANDLDSLRTQLSATPVDPRATARVLRRLGRRSQAVAPRTGILAGRVARLGDMLIEASAQLTPNAGP